MIFLIGHFILLAVKEKCHLNRIEAFDSFAC